MFARRPFWARRRVLVRCPARPIYRVENVVALSCWFVSACDSLASARTIIRPGRYGDLTDRRIGVSENWAMQNKHLFGAFFKTLYDLVDFESRSTAVQAKIWVSRELPEEAEHVDKLLRR